MLAAAAARLRDRHDLIWVDMGGGTGVSACRLGPAKVSDSLRFDHPVPRTYNERPLRDVAGDEAHCKRFDSSRFTEQVHVTAPAAVWFRANLLLLQFGVAAAAVHSSV